MSHSLSSTFSRERVSSEMIILARDSRGLTQAELAAATNISQANISKYESGSLNVSKEHVKRIADALDYPLSMFYFGEKRYGFGSSCTYHLERSTMPVRELRVLLARVNLLRIQAVRLLTGADIESDNEFQRLDIDDFDGDCEHIAALVRRAWKLPPGPIENLVETIEDAGGIVFASSFGTRKLDAISQWVGGVPPIFLLNSDMPGDRLRYTLAHEVGHLIMHRVPTENMEEEADRFAAEFLMPAADIEPDLHSLALSRLAQLKAYWKVSMAALIVRAKDLSKITERQYRALFEQMGRMGYKTVEPTPIPMEQPTLAKELVEFYLNAHGYSVEEISQFVGVPVHDLIVQYGLAPRMYVIRKPGERHDNERAFGEQPHGKVT